MPRRASAPDLQQRTAVPEVALMPEVHSWQEMAPAPMSMSEAQSRQQLLMPEPPA